MKRALALMAALAAAPVWADAPETSIHPVPRGGQMVLAAADITRPETRPDLEEPAVIPAAILLAEPNATKKGFVPNEDVTELAVASSLRPARRTSAVVSAAAEAKAARLRGQVCGDPDIQGEALGNVSGSGACGVEDAVRLRSVAGISFSERPTVDCATAKALKTWVKNGLRPAIGSEGGGVSQILVAGSYTCRPRNNQRGARLSEHSFGRAIDIAGFKLANGERISVLTDWRSSDDGAQLRQMHSAACGPFGTVLGPDANAEHRDHFHFDTARYRSGSYCR